ncbi:MAG: hypothetical protein M1546_13975 [Chloroflexi bacterium]|nr:hypothetical protein [Chloroflexota bacterium]
MPDGDRIHPTLPRRYEHAYKQVCEGHFSPDELAYRTLKPLAQDLKEYGDGPIRFIKGLADELCQIPREPMLRATYDWDGMRTRFRKQARFASGGTRAIEIAILAGERMLNQVRFGEREEVTYACLVKEYATGVYRARFVDCVPLVPRQNDANHGAVVEMLEAMNPHIERGIDAFTAQIIKSDGVDKLRRPSRAKDPVSLDEDLTAAY